MELDITKAGPKGNKGEVNFFTIKNYTTIPTSPGLLLVKEGVTEVDEHSEGDLLEIFKVQFIALCDTELANSIMVAFYLGEGGDLCPYILSGLPDRYYQDVDRHRLIDYKSYAEICELTGETKLPLYEYISEVQSGYMSVNTFLVYQGQVYNHDDRKKLYNPEPLLTSQDN